MKRVCFVIHPGFAAINRSGTEPVTIFVPRLSFFSWTMLSAVSLATAAAAIIWFG